MFIILLNHIPYFVETLFIYLECIFQSDYMAKYVVEGNFDQSVRNLLHKIMGKELSLHYNFSGVGEGNQDFQTTNMWDVILGEQ